MKSSDEILAFIRQSKSRFVEAYSVKRIGVFGSVVRGTAVDGSDVDILVELAVPTFDHYMDLKFELEDALGMPVDLVIADTLKPRLRPIIEQELVYV